MSLPVLDEGKCCLRDDDKLYEYQINPTDNKNNKAEVTMGTVDKMSMMNAAMTNLYRVCAKIDQLSYQC